MEMYVHNMRANYDLGDLGKHILITQPNTLRKASQGMNYFYHSHKNNQFCNIILFQFVVSTTLDRLKTDL